MLARPAFLVLTGGLTCVRAEHSTYLTALRSRASFSAVSGVIGFCLFLANFSTVEGSSRRSIWVPTNRNGVLGQWWVISGTHWRKKQKNYSGCWMLCMKSDRGVFLDIENRHILLNLTTYFINFTHWMYLLSVVNLYQTAVTRLHH